MELQLICISNKCVPYLHWEAYFMIQKVQRAAAVWLNLTKVALLRGVNTTVMVRSIPLHKF